MAFSIRPYRRSPVHCSVTYHADLFLKLPSRLTSSTSTQPRRTNSTHSYSYATPQGTQLCTQSGSSVF